MDRYEFQEIKNRMDSGYISKSLKPKKCWNCDSTKIKIINIAYDLGSVTEKKAVCESCEKQLGNWSYGYWEV